MCSIISRKVVPLFKKKARKMSKLGGAASGAASGAAAGSVLGPWGAAAGGVIGGVAGFFGSSDQEEEQKKLTAIQGDANAKLMGQSYALQKDMYDYTYEKNKAATQVKNLKEAGLNPALMYQSGGGGVSNTATGGGSSSVGGGTASGSAERKAAETQQIGMALQLAKLKSEVEVNESVAEVNQANATKALEDATTTGSSRDTMIEKLRQEGIGQWLENVRTRWMNEGDQEDVGMHRNSVLNVSTAIMAQGGFSKQVAIGILKAVSETAGIDANAILTNKKAEGYWQELLNETIKAEAAKTGADAAQKQAENGAINAAAQKLASEWTTGEYTNWKTWADLAVEAVGTIGEVAGSGKKITSAVKDIKELPKAAKPIKGFGR